MPSTPFFVSDTSPLFKYTPENAWQAAYRADGNGWDETFHATFDGDATVGIKITASAFSFQTASTSAILEGDEKEEDSDLCETQYRINGSDWLDACSEEYLKSDLPLGLHQIELKGKNGQGVEFMGLQGEIPIHNIGSAINQTIDSGSSSFNYTSSSQWTKLSSTSNMQGSTEPYANFTLKSMYEGEGLNGFFSNSLAGTTVQGAKVDLTFQGEAIYLYGLSGPNCGLAQVSLDGEIQQDINMKNTWEIHGSLLYVGSGFNPNDTHTLSIVNNQQGEQLMIDFALLTVPQLEKKSMIPLIASISGGVGGLLVFIGLIWFCFSRRKKRKIKKSRGQLQTKYAFADGIGGGGKDGLMSSGKSTYSSVSSSINEWRRPPSSLLSPITTNSSPGQNASINGTSCALGSNGEYIWGTGRPAGLDLSSARTPNSTANTNTPATSRTGEPVIQPPFRSPPPDYPDYIPYQAPQNVYSPSAPISSKSTYRPTVPRSATAPNPITPTADSTSPNMVVSAASISHSTNEWIKTVSKARAVSPSSLHSAKSSTSVIERMTKPLNLTSTKMGKPEYDNIPLDNYTYSNPNQRPMTPPPIPSEYGDYTPTTAQTPYGRYIGSPTAIMPEATERLKMNQNQSISDSNIELQAQDYPLGGGGLQRGPSIRSMSTMKSWLSNLIFAPPGTSTMNNNNNNRVVNSNTLFSVPESPNINIPEAAAARPDSGIFPLSLNGSISHIPLPIRSSPTSMSSTPIQMVPGTATRSFFGSRNGSIINSPGTSRSYGFGFTGTAITPKSSTSTSSYSNFIVTSGNGARPLPSRSNTESSFGNSYIYENSNYVRGSNGIVREREVQGNEMFIALNPNSPIVGDSRPGSEWTYGGRAY
ncbi:uncharacterized protein L201_001772 [Kwoniella dendrophila CBS 6074]|uniref:Uncharacterized protein n=1 Tax=Kwoniella dendrophila CBS 6074 TaxID=1295534 RepID=A0AAX4JQW4_9TREE